MVFVLCNKHFIPGRTKYFFFHFSNSGVSFTNILPTKRLKRKKKKKGRNFTEIIRNTTTITDYAAIALRRNPTQLWL